MHFSKQYVAFNRFVETSETLSIIYTSAKSKGNEKKKKATTRAFGMFPTRFL